MSFIYCVKKVLPLIFVLAVAGYFYVKNISDKLSFNIQAVKLDYSSSLASGFQSLYFDVDLSVLNKNSFPIAFNSYGVDFYYKGVKAGSIVRKTGVEISPNIESVTTARLSVAVSSLPPIAAGLVSDLANGSPVYFDVKAMVKTNFFGSVPYSTKIQVV